MITGIVTVAREAVISLTVHGPNGQAQEIEAVIDTGFDGSLTFTPGFHHRSRVTVASAGVHS